MFRSFVRSIVDDYKRKRGEDLRKRVERTEFDEVVNVTQRERERGDTDEVVIGEISGREAGGRNNAEDQSVV